MQYKVLKEAALKELDEDYAEQYGMVQSYQDSRMNEPEYPYEKEHRLTKKGALQQDIRNECNGVRIALEKLEELMSRVDDAGNITIAKRELERPAHQLKWTLEELSKIADNI